MTKMSVLVIEDDENFASLVAKALSGLADEIHIVSNWKDAFDRLDTGVDTAAWVDLRMPGVTEDDAIANIHTLRVHNPGVVIIVGSGYVTPYIRAKLERAGVDAVHYKDASFKAEQVASLITLGIMRASMRVPDSDRIRKILSKALDWMTIRFPHTAIP